MSPSVTVNIDLLPGRHRLYGCSPSLYGRSHSFGERPITYLKQWCWTGTLLRDFSIFSEQLVAMGAAL